MTDYDFCAICGELVEAGDSAHSCEEPTNYHNPREDYFEEHPTAF